MTSTTRPARHHQVRLGDAEMAVLLGVARRSRRIEAPALAGARASLVRRRLVQVHDAGLHLPVPLAQALALLAAPEVALSVDRPEPHDAVMGAIGGAARALTALAVHDDRAWTVWTAPTSELGDELARLDLAPGAALRLTRRTRPGAVRGVEVPLDDLATDPGTLGRLLGSPPFATTGPDGTAN